MVDGSNESLYYPDEELDPNLRKGLPLQKSFEKFDVWKVIHPACMQNNEASITSPLSRLNGKVFFALYIWMKLQKRAW